MWGSTRRRAAIVRKAEVDSDEQRAAENRSRAFVNNAFGKHDRIRLNSPRLVGVRVNMNLVHSRHQACTQDSSFVNNLFGKGDCLVGVNTQQNNVDLC